MTPREYYELATERLDKCNLCGSKDTDWTIIAASDRFNYPVCSISCMVCGLTFISPRMPACAYEQFYATGEYRRFVSKLTATTTPLEETQALYANIIRDFLRDTLASWKGSTILDIGGSTGIVAAKLRDEFGLVPTILEPCASEAEQAQARGLEAIQGTVDTFNPKKRRWNIIGIFQSIDHFLDPRAALTKAREWMEPGGLLILDIAELRLLLLLRKQVEAICKIDHPFGFTDWTMRAYLDQVGFPVIHTGYSKGSGKQIYVCRRHLPMPGTLPLSRSVTDWFALLHRVRLEQELTSHASAVA